VPCTEDINPLGSQSGMEVGTAGDEEGEVGGRGLASCRCSVVQVLASVSQARVKRQPERPGG
jgi:hypothetical protein